MKNERTICVICAWRETCNKKFSMDGSTTTRCLDFTRDVTLKQTGADNRPKDDSGSGQSGS